MIALLAIRCSLIAVALIPTIGLAARSFPETECQVRDVITKALKVLPADYPAWRRVAEGGDRSARLLVGLLHTTTTVLGERTDKSEGVRWLEAAVDQGSIYAISLLRSHFSMAASSAEGEEKLRLESLAAHWAHEGAKKGSMDEQQRFGNYLSSGYGVERSARAAVYWWQQAAEQGSRLAQWRLASAYAKGQGVEQNLRKGVEWGILAARPIDGVQILGPKSTKELESWTFALSAADSEDVQKAVAARLADFARSEMNKADANERECGVREFNKNMIR